MLNFQGANDKKGKTTSFFASFVGHIIYDMGVISHFKILI